mmetsp:Transcript_45710/g.138587  ORF Transcript_45710/g.138587 Transcript_45710/m.138587 type:complete len:209 (+) Transcript_45710:376-1002(+)
MANAKRAPWPRAPTQIDILRPPTAANGLLAGLENRHVADDVRYGALGHVECRVELANEPLAYRYCEKRRGHIALHHHVVLLHREHDLPEHVGGVRGLIGVNPQWAHELVHNRLDVLFELRQVHLGGHRRLVEALQVVDDGVCVPRTERVQKSREWRHGFLVQRGCDACVEHGDMPVFFRVQDVAAVQVAVDEVIADHHFHAHIVQQAT